MSPLRMLFVDDEPSIRLTLPAILRMHGHDVEAASSVAEALAAIQARKFEVLISDLNIGSPGDGFTVVSAMRRTQPECLTLILTGYPGFETALQAIRSQVDDYLVKPTQIQQLVDTIERKLVERKPHTPMPMNRVGDLLRDHHDEIVKRTLDIVGDSNKTLGKEAARGFPELVRGIAASMNPDAQPQTFAEATAHGRLRRTQGSTVAELFQEFRAFERVVYEVVQENLLAMDVSNLVPDLRMFNDRVQDAMQHSVDAYLSERAAA
jgi:Response regulator containing CheY-like receiver, AAA-type ATPase, and DNA-binding domains